MIITNKNQIQVDLDKLHLNTLQHIKSKKIFDSAQALPKEIEALKPQDLKVFVDRVIASLAKEKNALAFVEHFAKLLSTVNLGKVAKIDFPEFQGVRKAAEQMKIQAKDYLEFTSNEPPSSTWSIKLCRAGDLIISLFEGFLESFGLTNLFDTNEDAQTKTKKIIALVAFIFAASAVLIPILGLSHGFLGIALIALLLVGTGQLYPLIRPMPVYIPDMENQTKKYWEGHLRISPQTVEESTVLASELGPRRPVILSGPSGVGKTELAKTFVRDVAREKYPHLKGKRCFYVNAVGLSADKLPIISRNMKRHRNNIIVIFDNLQDADPKLRNQLKLMLKDGAHFPNFIGLTTEPNFLSHGKVVELKGTSLEQTENIVRYAALQSPNVLIDHRALDTIATKAKETFGPDAIQPKAALTLLSSCVHKTSISQRSPLEHRVNTLREQVQSASKQRVIGSALSLLPYGKKQEPDPQQEELTKLEESLATENKERATFFARREQLQKLKIAVHKNALKINDKSSKKEKDFFLLLSHYFLPAFEKSLKEEAKRLHLKTEINETLIDRVIKSYDVPSKP